MFEKWIKISLWQRALAALAIGWLVGQFVPVVVPFVEPLGQIFVNLIKMIVIPLIVTTLIVAITGVGSYKDLRVMGVTTILWFLITAVIATILGLVVAKLLNIGAGAQLVQEDWKGWDVPPVIKNVVDLVPSNPIKAMVNGQVVPVVVFTLLIAISAVQVGKGAEPFVNLFKSFSEVLFKLVRFIMEISPIGIFAIIAGVTNKYGADIIMPLIDVIFAIYLVAIIHIVFVYGGLLYTVAKVNPFKYFKKILPASITAFSTTSSYGTLPVTLDVVQKAGVSKRVASFVVPLGATINMDGCGAFYPAIAAVFIANLYGISLGFESYAIIVVVATLSSLGTAGVPWSSATALMMVLPAVGLPIEAVALLFSIDRILDMARTAVNVTGDTVVSAIVSRKVGDFNDEKLADDAKQEAVYT